MSDDKLDKIVDKISSIDVTLAKQSVILEEHVRRTNLLEEKIEPIESHVIVVNGIAKFIGAVALVVGMIVGIIEIIRWFTT